MKSYVTYEWYVTNTRGTCPQEAFERLAGKASRYIDGETMGRAAALPEGDSRKIAVKYCCCELIDEMLNEEQGGGIASESNDGISVNYVRGISNTKSPEQRLYLVLLRGLARTGLLCRGGGNQC